MTEVRLLSTSGDDAVYWRTLLERVQREVNDVHYSPEYMRIYESTYDVRCEAFEYRSSNGTHFLQPILFTPLPKDLAGAAGLSGQWWDARNVYGYGGPLNLGEQPVCREALASFRSALDEILLAEKVISEFCLLHPLFSKEQQRSFVDVELDFHKDVCCIDLSSPLEELWAGIYDRQRKAIFAARNRGVEVKKKEITPSLLSAFQARYLVTMERVGATDFWHFPERYFPACYEELGEDRVSIFEATKDGQWLATYFLMHQGAIAYYHFSANSHNTDSGLGNALLMFETMLWAKSKGYSYYHLGGGRTSAPDDSLARFKGSFNAMGYPLYGYKRVINQAIFDSLVRAIPADDLDEDFFPPYRKGRTL